MIIGSNPSPLPVPQDKSCDVQPQKKRGFWKIMASSEDTKNDGNP